MVKVVKFAAGDQESNMIYTVAELELYNKVKDLGGKKVKFQADFDVVKKRFSTRMNGNLPAPVEKMLEAKANLWKNINGDIVVDTSKDGDIQDNLATIIDD